jgi:hypothetical protein
MSVIRQAWVEAHRRRDLRPIYEWSKEKTDLKPPLTITGPFDVSRSRHFMAPLDALQDEHVREVNILKPVRGGGTLLADVWIPWTRENDPGPVMMVLQTDPLADDHFTKVLLPTLESVPSIKLTLDAMDRHKKTNRKIEFPDGNHLHVNGPSIGNLQTNAFRYVIEDECWLYDLGRMADAEGRVGDFLKMETSKILRISQGGPRPGISLDDCPWNRAYQNAAIYEWEVACVHCGNRHEPVFAGARADGSFWGITWDHHKLPNGDWNIQRCCETIRFECPHCAKPVLDTPKTKSEWNRTGNYRLANEPHRKKKSFHWEAVIDFPWDELVDLWLNACNAERRGGFQDKLAFYQKRRAQHKDEESIRRGGFNLKRVAYDLSSEWPEQKAKFLTVDRQDEDLFWWEVRGWSLEKSRRLGFGKCYGFAAVEDIRIKFGVQQNHTLIDSAHVPKGDHGVYAACIRYGWIAVRGDDDHAFVHRMKKSGRSVLRCYSEPTHGDPNIGTTTQGRRFCPLIRFSKPQLNQKVQDLIEAGRWEEPISGEDPEMEKEYNAQMASRMRKTEYNKKTNELKTFWWEGKNDHARDLANMSTLGAILKDLLPDPSTEVLSKSEQKEVTE